MKPDTKALWQETLAEFPKFRTRYKRDVWWMRALGKLAGASFLDSFLTTIGTTVYLPNRWDAWSEGERCALLRHERVHLRQQRRLTLPLFLFLYAVVFFPVGLAYGRARLEQEAYAEQLLALKDYGMDYAGERDRFVGYFAGSAYLFMWPFRAAVQRWFDGVVAKLKAS